MTHRTFTSSKQEPSPSGPTFDLAGLRRDGKTEWSEMFTTVHQDDVPPGVYEDLAGAMWVDDGKIIYGRSGLLRFMDQVLVPEDRDRFAELLRDVDRRLDLELVGDAMMWLVTELASRPTGGQPSSPDGLSSTEGSSEGDSPSPAGDSPTTSTG